MQLTQSTSMRQEMRQLLTPRMIQSMEILQLPLLALEERIEQELENNPVLELQAGDSEPLPEIQDESTREEYSEGERALVV
jgi:RNA polymerase sigma-54 factor